MAFSFEEEKRKCSILVHSLKQKIHSTRFVAVIADALAAVRCTITS